MPGPGRKPAIEPTLRRPPRWRDRLSTKASDNSVNARTLRSIIWSCSSRSRALAIPARPNPALLMTNCGSAPCAASASAIRRVAPGFRRSAAITIGRRAPVEAISSASVFNLSSLRATSASSWPLRAKTRASATPIPAEAPVMIVIGRGFVIPLQSRAPDHRARQTTTGWFALFEKFARWVVARKHRLLDELFRIEGPELADLRIGVDNGVSELSVHTRHFANVNFENRRAVLVEPHRADRPMREADILHRLEEGRCVVSFASGGFQRLFDDEKRRIRTCGIEPGIVFIGLVDAGDEFLVVGRVETGRVPAAGDDTHSFVAHHSENALVGACGVAEHGDFALQPEFAELLEKAQRIAARKTHVDGVHIAFDRGKIRCVFRCVERRPQL